MQCTLSFNFKSRGCLHKLLDNHLSFPCFFCIENSTHTSFNNVQVEVSFYHKKNVDIFKRHGYEEFVSKSLPKICWITFMQ